MSDAPDARPDPATPADPDARPRPATPADPDGAVSAAPPVLARVAAFASIVIAGACGGLIGYSVMDLNCGVDGCTGLASLVGALSALGAAVGVAVVAVLTLRAMGEWRATPERDRRTR